MRIESASIKWWEPNNYASLVSIGQDNLSIYQYTYISTYTNEKSNFDSTLPMQKIKSGDCVLLC